MSEDLLSPLCNLSSDELSFLMDVCNIAREDSDCQILLNEMSLSEQQSDSEIAGLKKIPIDPLEEDDINLEFDFNVSDLRLDEEFEETFVHFQTNLSDSDFEKSQVNHENYYNSNHFHSLTSRESNTDQDGHQTAEGVLFPSSNSFNELQTFEVSSISKANCVKDEQQATVVSGLSGCVIQMSRMTETFQESSPTSEMATTSVSPSGTYSSSLGKLTL
jgi:hypothetical protein